MSDKTKALELIYSTQHTDFIKGRAYSNPRFYSTPRSGVAKVYIIGHWPKIEADYAAQGVPVERLDRADAEPAPAFLPTQALTLGVAEADRDSIHIPGDWAELGWSKPNEAGLTLRGLAAQFSATPVLNKADASAAIQAELTRRAATVAEATSDEPAE